jgi:hypothetical protein
MSRVWFPAFIVVVEVFVKEVPPVLRRGGLFKLAVFEPFLIVLVQ